jgi:pimeloyl-ACP methyl ester carboxylesterase
VSAGLGAGDPDADAAAERERERVEAAGRRHDLVAEGCRVAWRCWGRGPVVVLLHGGSGGWNHWIRNVEALAGSGLRVLVPEMPGYGDSDNAPLPHAARTLARVLSRGLRALLAESADGEGEAGGALGEAFALVGFSFGSVVAAQWAALEPGRVRQLVLVGAMGFGPPRDRAIDLRPWKHLTDPEALADVQRHNLGALMFHDQSRIDALAMRLHLRNTERTRFVSRWISRGDALADLLPELDVALHAVWGMHDVTAAGGVANCVQVLQALRPGAGCDVIEDAGHWVQYERATEFNAVLRAVLGRGGVDSPDSTV